ncbi:MAG: single-stranded DNA-binding protein [Candidatus Pacebacteria bacterium]|nr:single-stranded DNA-binding protein [Candidatus Paceibacterota bacterium]
MLNNCDFMGRFVADPELRKTPNDVSVVNFTLAVDRDFTPKGKDKECDFLDFVAWRQQADFIAKYFHKGSQAAVNSSIQTRSYEDKAGNKRKAYEFNVNHIYFAGGKNNSGSSNTTQENANSNADLSDDDLPF